MLSFRTVINGSPFQEAAIPLQDRRFLHKGTGQWRPSTKAFPDVSFASKKPAENAH